MRLSQLEAINADAEQGEEGRVAGDWITSLWGQHMVRCHHFMADDELYQGPEITRTLNGRGHDNQIVKMSIKFNFGSRFA